MKMFTAKTSALIIFPTTFLIGVFLVMWFSLTFIEAESKQGIHKSLNTVLNITQATLQLWLNSRLDELKYIATDTELGALTQTLLARQHSQQSSDALEKIRVIMAVKMRLHNDIGFFIIAPDRSIIASIKNFNIGSAKLIHQQRKLYFDQAFMGATLFIPSIDSDFPLSTQSNVWLNKQAIFCIASPIFDNNNRVIAVLILLLNPMTDFSQITKLGRIGDTGETYAFDKKGLLITNSRFINHFGSSEIIGNNGISLSSIRVTDPGGNLLQGYQSKKIANKDRPLTLMAQRVLSGDYSPFFDSYRDYRGVPVFGVWLWNKTLGIGLTTEIDAKEALLTYELIRMVIISVLVTIVMLTIGLILFLLWLQEKEKGSLKQNSDLLKQTVNIRTAELKEAIKNLKILSEIDPLTQISNRRLYQQTLARDIVASKRASQAMSLMIIDIDFFKLFNDNYGHHKGDITLKHVAQLIADSLTRETDLAARYGGEEFVVLMPSTDAHGAKQFADQIRANIEAQAIEHNFSAVADVVTVSIGVASLMGNKLNATDLFRQADNALYQAKENGRNQISLYQSG
jgi:diguanylate cyclase (GGDEF)-like protein